MVDTSERETVDNGRRLIKVDEAAHLLGLSVRAVYRLMASGELPPPVKIGKATRIIVAEIDEYIERLKSRRDQVDFP